MIATSEEDRYLSTSNLQNENERFLLMPAVVEESRKGLCNVQWIYEKGVGESSTPSKRVFLMVKNLAWTNWARLNDKNCLTVHSSLETSSMLRKRTTPTIIYNEIADELLTIAILNNQIANRISEKITHDWIIAITLK